MKKLLSYVAICATIAIVASCSKQQYMQIEESPDEQQVEGQQYIFNFSVNNGTDFQTKAVKESWVEGDLIYVFFKNVAAGYATMTYNGTEWNTVQQGTFELGASGELTAIYMPYGISGKAPAFEENMWNVSNSDAFFSNTITDYTVSGDQVKATLNMTIFPNYMQFWIPETDKVDLSRTTLVCNRASNSSVVTEVSDYLNVVAPEGLKMAAHRLDQGDAKGFAYYGIFRESESKNTTFSLYTSDKIYSLRKERVIVANKAYRLNDIKDWEERPGGTVYGEFSVSEKLKVNIAKGNLYSVKQGDGSYKFYIENEQTAYNKNGHEDSHNSYFFWCVDGNDACAATYPYDKDYRPATGSVMFTNATATTPNSNLTIYQEDEFGEMKADKGLWRTLSFDEWQYLLGFETSTSWADAPWTYYEQLKMAVPTYKQMTLKSGKRPNAANLYRFCTVKDSAGKDVKGFVIAPDDYDFTNMPLQASYTAEEFYYAQMEGVMFLPATGHIEGGVYYKADTKAPGQDDKMKTFCPFWASTFGTYYANGYHPTHWDYSIDNYVEDFDANCTDLMNIIETKDNKTTIYMGGNLFSWGLSIRPVCNVKSKE